MAGLLPDAELRAMRQTAESSLDTSAEIWRASVVDDGSGHQTTGSPALVWQPKPVFVRLAEPKPALLAVLADRIGKVDIWLVSYSLDLDVQVLDQFRLADGTALTVHSIGGPQSYATVQSAVCAKVR